MRSKTAFSVVTVEGRMPDATSTPCCMVPSKGHADSNHLLRDGTRSQLAQFSKIDPIDSAITLKKKYMHHNAVFYARWVESPPRLSIANSFAATFLLENCTNPKLGGRAARMLFTTYLSRIGLCIWINSETHWIIVFHRPRCILTTSLKKTLFFTCTIHIRKKINSKYSWAIIFKCPFT